jgi:hypothetical protein
MSRRIRFIPRRRSPGRGHLPYPPQPSPVPSQPPMNQIIIAILARAKPIATAPAVDTTFFLLYAPLHWIYGAQGRKRAPPSGLPVREHCGALVLLSTRPNP